ncbi:CST complex subunit Ten1 [Neohortaea acidophila]|uniref:CST complex subunit Ten1 n=1 Tax=Neohortaea acidophila TaxID=245834 RepID=A0A6A6PSW3_9PEZI|nr:CST complex subunit Ten1 [Neohortaea acidophila]KAF2482774.1 CST complex subunit Ten1 [Neohortaea acidophila]
MPEPSRLMLLEQLPKVLSGTKVRFLGCVHEYNADQAKLVLRSAYPAVNTSVPCALVNVENVLELVDHRQLETGAWVNVVGYIEKDQEFKSLKSDQPSSSVMVRATLIWSAGAIRMDRYEAAVREYQKPLSAG